MTFSKFDIICNEEDGCLLQYSISFPFYDAVDLLGVLIYFSKMEATAKHDFVATADDELSFPRGAKLKVSAVCGSFLAEHFNRLCSYLYRNEFSST